MKYINRILNYFSKIRVKNTEVFLQRICGISMLVVCIAMVTFALHGNTIEEKDITPVLLFAPIGVGATFGRVVKNK